MMQYVSSARQISASTIGQYRAMAASYRDGTWDHDVSRGAPVQTFAQHPGRARPMRGH
jgi:hypothetical protein